MGKTAIVLCAAMLTLPSCMPYWGRVYQAPPAQCHVVDAVSGQPVANATVRYERAGGDAAVTAADGTCTLPGISQTEFHVVMPGMALAAVPVVASHASLGTGYGFATHPLLDRWGTTVPVAILLLPRDGAQDLTEDAYLTRLAQALEPLLTREAFRQQVAADPRAFDELANARFPACERMSEAQAAQLRVSLDTLRALARAAAK